MGTFKDVFPVTNLRNSYLYCEEEHIESQKDHALAQSHSSQTLPLVLGVYVRCLWHILGASPGTGTVSLGKIHLIYLLRKCWHLNNDLHMCGIFANGDWGHI